MVNVMTEFDILKYLVEAGMTPASACGFGGNIQAESTFKSNIAQRGLTNYSDEEYTRLADEGIIDFTRDSVGYGLCQWTYWTRKAELLSYAKQTMRSVGDPRVQAEFIVRELKEHYPDLWGFLCTCNGVYDAASRVCTEYERPAVNNIDARAGYGNLLMMQYGSALSGDNHAIVEMPPPVAPETPEELSLPTVTIGSHTPEAKYLKALLEELGYDISWEGITQCLKDFQHKKGLVVDAICGPKTWKALLSATNGR